MLRHEVRGGQEMNAEFASTATAVEEVAAGVARSAAEVVSDPVRSARRQVRAFERKGTPVVRRINKRLNALLPDRLRVFGLDVNGKLPEKVAIKGLQLVKVQARRPAEAQGRSRRQLRLQPRAPGLSIGDLGHCRPRRDRVSGLARGARCRLSWTALARR